MSRLMRKLLAVALVLVPLSAARAEAPATLDEIKPVLTQLGVTLQVTQRPTWPKVTVTSVTANLVPQTDLTGPTVVSFGLPFPPDSLTDDKNIKVTGPNGAELAVFTKPLVKWWIDRKEGAIRSVLIQFEATFQGKTPQTVTITWDKPRTKTRPTEVASVDTQFKRHVDPPATFKTADPYDYQCPKVLALLPANWLCNSLVAWQQITMADNKAGNIYPWFDEHYAKVFPGSLPNISANPAGFEAHLFDRPAGYAKFYVRSGDEKQLAAALAANDYYRQHITPEGFFDVKKEANGQPAKDLKYVYSEGTAIMYMLTGDENYKETLKRVAKGWETHRRIEFKGEGFWTERHHGFGMMAWDHLYELTGDPKYLDNAKRFFNAALDMQVHPGDGKAPDGAWLHTAEAHGDGDGWTTSPWMSAFLTDAIWKYWMLSGDERAPASLAMYDKFAAKYAVTKDGKYVNYMANSPGRGKPENNEDVAHNTEGIYLMSMGYYFSGGADKDYLAKIEGLKPGLLDDGANRPGRKFNWRFRETSMGLWFLANASKPMASK
jgi:hypothetical protein